MNGLSLAARRLTALTLRQPRGISALMLQALSSRANLPEAPEVIRMPAHDLPKSFAVEAPDGTSDAQQDSELSVTESMQNYTPPLTKAQIFAVDAPDGEADVVHETEVHAVEEIIDYAAVHEDKDQVMRRHELDEERRRAIREGKYYGF